MPPARSLHIQKVSTRGCQSRLRTWKKPAGRAPSTMDDAGSKGSLAPAMQHSPLLSSTWLGYGACLTQQHHPKGCTPAGASAVLPLLGAAEAAGALLGPAASLSKKFGGRAAGAAMPLPCAAAAAAGPVGAQAEGSVAALKQDASSYGVHVRDGRPLQRRCTPLLPSVDASDRSLSKLMMPACLTWVACESAWNDAAGTAALCRGAENMGGGASALLLPPLLVGLAHAADTGGAAAAAALAASCAASPQTSGLCVPHLIARRCDARYSMASGVTCHACMHRRLFWQEAACNMLAERGLVI